MSRIEVRGPDGEGARWIMVIAENGQQASFRAPPGTIQAEVLARLQEELRSGDTPIVG